MRQETTTVRQLARRIGADPKIVLGVAIGLKIIPERTPAALLFTRAEAERIAKHYETHPVPTASNN